nr:putative VV A8L-like transcription factor [Kaumoebavirus]
MAILLNYLSPDLSVKQQYVFLNGEDRDRVKIAKLKSGGDAYDEMFKGNKTTAKSEVNWEETIRLYPEDRISEIKQKIYLASGIGPHEQHLFVKIPHSYPLNYSVYMNDDLQIVDLEGQLSENKGDDVNGLPIDQVLYDNRTKVRVEALDSFLLLSALLQRGVREMFMFSLSDFITERPSSDYFDYIYYGFVIKYFPMLTREVFAEYITTPEEISSHYPEMVPNLTTLQQSVENENRIYENMENLLDNEKVLNNIKDDIYFGIKSATLTIHRTLPRVAGKGVTPIINIRALFDSIRLKEHEIIQTELLTEIGGKYYSIKKFLRVHGKPTRRSRLLYNNSISVTVERDRGSYAEIIIYETGQYQIVTTWKDEMRMTFEKIRAILEKEVGPYIQSFNKYPVFLTEARLSASDKYNAHFTDIDLNFYYKKHIDDIQFKQFVSEVRAATNAHIFNEKETSIKNAIGVYFFKGIVDMDLLAFERGLDVSNLNYYAHYSVAELRAKWKYRYERGRSINILHRISDVKFEIHSVRQDEFEVLFNYLLTLIWSGIYKSKSTDKGVVKPMKKIKKLKITDPELYNFDNGAKYSTKCQNPHQPIIYTPKEFNTMSKSQKEKLVKFWNFTTQEPAYYECPNPKHPNLSFITDIHPKNYCIPCCKITARTETNPNSKKNIVYERCMAHKVYEKDQNLVVNARYVMNYGKDLDTGRLMKLPDIYEKFLRYNSLNSDEQSYFIFGVPQINKIACGALYAAAELLQIRFEDFVKKLAEDPETTDSQKATLRILQTNSAALENPADINKMALQYLYRQGYTCLILSERHIKCLQYTENLKTIFSQKNYMVFFSRKVPVNDAYHKFYYPVVEANSVAFFKQGVLTRRIFDKNTDIIQFLQNILSNIKKSEITYESFTIDTLTTAKVKVNKYLVDQDKVYAAIVGDKNDLAYFPIKAEYYLPDKPVEKNLDIGAYELKSSSLFALCAKLNLTISEIIEYKSIKNGTPYYAAISNGYPLYFNKIDEPLDKYRMEKSDYDILFVNTLVSKKSAPVDDFRKKEATKSLYTVYLYKLLCFQLIQMISKERNTEIRGKIKKIESSRLEEFLPNLRRIVPEEDFKLISINKKRMDGLMNFIHNTQFSFDRKLSYLKTIDEVKTYLSGLDSLVVFDEVVGDGSTDIFEQNSLSSCDNEHSWCDKNKLKIKKDIYESLKDVLAHDLTNPFKKAHFLLRLQMENYIDLMQFTKGVNEVITLQPIEQ